MKSFQGKIIKLFFRTKNNSLRLTNKTTRLLKIIWLLPLFLIFACGDPESHKALSSNATVLAFGDSVTYGTGAKKGEDYPSLLREKTNWNVINAGIPGDTAQKAQHRLAPLLTKYQPDLVIVELGGNDFLRKHPINEIHEALRSIIRQSSDFGATTILIAVPQFSLLRATTGTLNDSPIYAVLAEEESVLLAADIFSNVLSDDKLKNDPIHPNAAGYRQLNHELMLLMRKWGLLY